jgi:hydroxypyruvate isomerase
MHQLAKLRWSGYSGAALSFRTLSLNTPQDSTVIMDQSTNLSRRNLLAGAAAGAAAISSTGCSHLYKRHQVAKNGRIRHSIVHWCFNLFGQKWSLDRTCREAVALGCESVELVPPSGWETLKRYGLTCAIAPNGMPGAPFVKGVCNRQYHDEVFARTSKVIDAAAENDVPTVIAFTGMKWRNAEDPASGEIPHEEAVANSVLGLKRLASYAEKKGITIALEHLNSRVSDNDFKGHPGYQGDHIDVCMDILNKVGSERVKLLFDVYHVQIMDGDLVTRVKECGEAIAHVHTAGNPGRCELDQDQEINYRPVMQALVDIGYKGFVGHEFIPTRNPRKGLEQAVRTCDV